MLGKFLAGVALVAVALVLTLPLPVTVAFLGPLDWGPVVGGYVATLFLAGAYVAIGLYTSARTDNPIVALILATLVCAVFYLLGTPTLTTLFGYKLGSFLSLLGSGSRFESITRGVLDLRDLYYYLSIMGVFLALNLYTLERLRWAGNPATRRHRQWGWLVGLAAANFIAGNLWLAPVGWARADITHGHIYSLSDATRRYLSELQEPLLIRGYFSAKTHPLLAPLVPQIKDLLEEYAVAGKGKVRVEFVDPHEDPALEEEAASKYSIRPVPFQVASKYQSSVVSSYFDILVSYGDQYQTLSYKDLIEVKLRGDRDLDVLLKNPEYAVTRSIRKVLNAYQVGGNPFDTLTRPVKFTGYISPKDKLPQQLATLRADLDSVLDELKKEAGSKLAVSFEDPDANGGALAKKLKQNYGFAPQVASLFDPKPFWFYMVLDNDGDTAQVPLPEDLTKDGLKRSLNAAIQRLAPGFLKTVAVVKPQSNGVGGGKEYTQLSDILSENARLKDANLKDGQVPADADLLLVLAPDAFDDKQIFAVDQFLMRGGSLVLATSPFDATLEQTFSASKHHSGLEDWLKFQGLDLGDTMVLDPQNAALPVPVQRNLGGIPIREIRMLSYPYFPDIRGKGLNADNPITSALEQVTLNWASPITVDKDKNKARKVSPCSVHRRRAGSPVTSTSCRTTTPIRTAALHQPDPAVPLCWRSPWRVASTPTSRVRNRLWRKPRKRNRATKTKRRTRTGPRHQGRREGSGQVAGGHQRHRALARIGPHYPGRFQHLRDRHGARPGLGGHGDALHAAFGIFPERHRLVTGRSGPAGHSQPGAIRAHAEADESGQSAVLGIPQLCTGARRTCAGVGMAPARAARRTGSLSDHSCGGVGRWKRQSEYWLFCWRAQLLLALAMSFTGPNLAAHTRIHR